MAKSIKIKLNKQGKKALTIGAAVLIIVIAGILVVTNVFKGKSEPNKDETKNPVVETPKPGKLKIVNENSKSRPYAVMINNISVARKVQSGLQDAYIIYEIIVEGGITRYMALFKDQSTTRIGTVRSSRHYFLDYALENDAIYIHHGQSPQAASDFKTLNVDRIAVADPKTAWRDKSNGLSTEHTLYTSVELINKGVGGMRKETNKGLLLNYSVDEIDMASINNATSANNVSITYSSGTTSSYVYDKEHGYYLRSVNGKKHTDYVTNEQYHFKNIITYQVKNYTLKDSENKGRQGIENIGSGKGYYISGGYSIPITWKKESRTSQTKYYYENGEELKVNDGNTFIQIQPTGQKLSIS